MNGPPPQPDIQAHVDLAPCGLLRTDASGTIERVNLTFSRWLGYERAELLGRRLPDLLTVGARIFHQTHLAPLMQMQGSISEVKLEMLHRDGSKLPMVLNARRHLEEGRTFTEIATFVAHDRDKYERELVLARQRLEVLVAEYKALQAEASDRAQIAEQMVGIVSHDLRNPLQTIQMGAVLLARRDATPQQLGVLGRMTRAGERAQRLIADLLDFTQARLGRGIKVEPRSFELHRLIGDVVEELAQAFPGRGLVHEHEGRGECVADSDRVAQLTGNLIANAMAYGNAGAPVTVRTTVTAGQFEVAVHNDGAPIPPQAQAALFQPMVRGTEEGGASRSVGLGLFIVSEIARAHGGKVAVASAAPGGTTFTATFPQPG